MHVRLASRDWNTCLSNGGKIRGAEIYYNISGWTKMYCDISGGTEMYCVISVSLEMYSFGIFTTLVKLLPNIHLVTVYEGMSTVDLV